MTKASSRLPELIRNNNRKKNGIEICIALTRASITYSVLSNEAQDSLIEMLRTPGAVIHDRVNKLELDSIHRALDEIEANYVRFLPVSCVALSYAADEYPAFLINTEAFISRLRVNPFILSSDGIVLLSSSGEAGVILDFFEKDLEAPTELTALGLAANDGLR